MSKAILGALIAAYALLGCTKSGEQGGGAGNDTFPIVVPSTSTDVKQGELQAIRVASERSEGFKARVKLELKAPAVAP